MKKRIEKIQKDYLIGVVGRYLYDTYGIDLSEKGFDGMDASITDKILSLVKKEIMRKLPKEKKTYKNRGVAQVEADFTNFGGKKVKVGDINEFEVPLTPEEEIYNDCLSEVKELIKSL